MQKDNLDDIVTYPNQYDIEIAKFLKRSTLEQVKVIDQQRKKRQFMIISSSICNQSEHCDNNIQHLQKNRYGMMVYHHNRVIVNGIDNFYINASLMKSIVDNQVFAIFSQAPQCQSFSDFWQACYHFNVKHIFMLCPCVEYQADQYWPDKNETLQYQHLSIRCQQQQNLSIDLTKRLLFLKGKDGEKSIVHHHWSGWTDMKTPEKTNGPDHFKDLIQESLQSIERKELILVHCSAGLGRTGTFGAILQAIRCLKHKSQLSIFEIVDNLRRQRSGSVQTSRQYFFLFQYLSKHFHQF